jgi:hypothetical protein
MAEMVFDYKGITIEFCPEPNPELLRAVFAKLENPPDKGYFVYFSDDSCFSIRVPGQGVKRFNVDISQCDASHGAVFDALRAVTPEFMQENLDKLLEQCRAPITITPPRINGRRQRDANGDVIKIVLQPLRTILYTGTTITTPTNNMANILIALALADQIELNGFTDNTIDVAARSCGYIVTLDTCTIFEQMQFL